MAGLDPAIHALASSRRKAWMPGTSGHDVESVIQPRWEKVYRESHDAIFCSPVAEKRTTRLFASHTAQRRATT